MRKFFRDIICRIFHDKTHWKTVLIYNHEGEFSRYHITCMKCGRKWDR